MLPSLKVAVPMGVPEPVAVTADVKVTGWLKLLGFVPDAAWQIVGVGHFTVMVRLQPPARLPWPPGLSSITYKLQRPFGSELPKVEPKVAVPTGAGEAQEPGAGEGKGVAGTPSPLVAASLIVMLPWLLKDVAGVIVRFQLLMLPELKSPRSTP